jgi:hypothetical protein
VLGKYPDPVSKISLTLSVGQSAKSQIVKEFGVGEELAMNVLGWKGDRLVCVAQMDTSWPSSEEERVQRTGDAYMIMRRGWLCDSFTVMAEGFMSRDKDETRQLDLVEAYVDGTKGVNECLTINYVDLSHIELCAIPFRVALGRKVEWGPLVHSDDIDVLRNSEYVTMAQELLAQETMDIPEDTETFHLALAVGLHDSAGFFMQYDF